MTDQLGYRKKFGVIIPSTNTIVEPDFYRMIVPGVTAHISRIHIRDQNLSSDDAFENLLRQIRVEMQYAIERVMTCEPDYMVMGMSAETFWDGVEGNRRFTKMISDWAGGLRVATGAEACERALRLFNVRKIGVVTPYQPIGDRNVVRFFNDLGFDVTAIKGLRCPTAVAIAHVTEDTLRSALIEVNNDADALVQVGTNLSMVRLADEAERWLGKPVIAINAATWWMALRDNGIDDRVYGAG
ncbi:arylmalonate decarboxylase, partial [Roseiflexus sp.]|uniref:maleate cis-trans isomerase family protein n=1 Tax=Roseiflexus sp. TaxID=2562120 RepID=UPI00398B56DE